jgi:5-methylcytosine-specific restriction endonuclease McrA
MPPESDRVQKALRLEVAARALYLCEYCRCPEAFSPDSFTVDHIQPRQAGGETISENLAWSCSGCNGRKYVRTHYVDIETEQEVRLFNPRQLLWEDHFDWSDNFTQLVGKTPCGRATISALALNRTGVVNLRRLLVNAGLHPPSRQ